MLRTILFTAFVICYLGNDHLTWRGGGYGFFLKKYYDLEGKEIKLSVTALATKKYSALHIYYSI